MTVRQWFRLARAAEWQRDNSYAREIDALAAKICTSVPPREVVSCLFVWTCTGRDIELEIPREYVLQLLQAQAREALEELLQCAWPAADREKYDVGWLGRRAPAPFWRGILE